jgi:phosphate/phosphite/phosphonate ABC transporter binding protein
MKSTVFRAILVVVLGIGFLLLWAGTRVNEDELRISWEIAPAPPFVFGIIPYISGPELSREFDPLMVFLEKNLERPVKLLVASDYEMLGKLLDYGKVHVAWFSTASFENLNRSGDWEVLCRPMRTGTIRHRGIILSRVDRGFNSLKDLQGKTFGYVDRNSGTGYVYANRMMVEQGIDPLNFFGKIDFSGNHSISIDRLRQGQYDAIATMDVFTTPGLIREDERGDFRMLGATQWILNDPMVVRKDMAPVAKKQLLDLFVAMKRFPGGPETLAHLQDLRNWERFVDENEIQNGSFRLLGGGGPSGN